MAKQSIAVRHPFLPKRHEFRRKLEQVDGHLMTSYASGIKDISLDILFL
jgi:hypothetical protein